MANARPWNMVTVGVVLGAGGQHAAAYHAGALDGLQTATGWDPRTANVIVGTSAGALVAISLRAGLSATDMAAYHEGNSRSLEAQAIESRVTSPLHIPDPSLRSRSRRPANLQLLVKELFIGGRPRPMVAMAGLLPEGEEDGSSLARRAEQIHPEPWPTEATWICALDLRSGNRIVFGRDDIETSVGPAVQASAAMPGYFSPVVIGGRYYVDGGTHSCTNADLLAPLHLDLVIVSSSKTMAQGVTNVGGRSLSHLWHSRTLRREMEQIKARGTKVLLLQPTAADLWEQPKEGFDSLNLDSICTNGRSSTLARLAHPHAATARKLLEAHPTKNR